MARNITLRDLPDYGYATQAGREIGLQLAEGLISDQEAIEALARRTGCL
jgi:hypothetical protein